MVTLISFSYFVVVVMSDKLIKLFSELPSPKYGCRRPLDNH